MPAPISGASLPSRIRAAHLGCMLGDAIGRPFEMMSARDPRLAPALDRAFVSAEPLRYSDDSEMMIAVAESLVRCGGVEPDDLLATLAAHFDVARGYGHGMRRALEAAREGSRSVAFLVWPEGSKGNGGAVRVVPVACRFHEDVDRLAAAADCATTTTHAHAEGRAGGVAQALAIAHVLSRDADSLDARELLAAIVRAPLVAGASLGAKLGVVGELISRSADLSEAVAHLGNRVLAEEAFPLALFCFLSSPDDFSGVVRTSVLAGGDTDTVAAMSAAMCGALLGEAALPAAWLARLENGPRGRDHVLALADAVFAATP